MKDYLFIGGPRHGETHPVDESQSLFRTFAATGVRLPETGTALSPEDASMLRQTGPAYIPVDYQRRQLSFKFADGLYQREMFVVAEMGANEAEAALIHHLMSEFIHGGTRVIEGEADSVSASE